LSKVGLELQQILPEVSLLIEKTDRIISEEKEVKELSDVIG
jgi:hypothetical protein